MKDENDLAARAVPDLIRKQVLIYPDKIALRSGSHTYTYKELFECSGRWAALLAHHGVGPGDVVGVALPRRGELVAALLAIGRSGAAYLPIDPGYPRERIAFMLEDAGAKFLLTTLAYKDIFQTGMGEFSLLLLEDMLEQLPHYPVDDPGLPVLEGCGLAYILYTSGSTGKPKGVLVEQHSLVNLLLSMRKEPGMGTEDRLLAVTTISFDISGLELYLPLVSGGELILADDEGARDPRVLLDMIRRDRISIMQATPATWGLMLECGWEEWLPLKVLCGGEALKKELAERLLVRCQELWNMYGPTETTIWSTVKRLHVTDPVITIGKPIDHTRVYILDASGKPVVSGDIGEICIAGEGVARGYWKRPELTAERFVVERLGEAAAEGRVDRMYRTGDLGKWLDNGDVQCLGRIDQQVKVRGYRIEPAEIEYVLVRQSGIKQAVVVGEGDGLVAYVVPDGSGGEWVSRWRRAVAKVLPAYMAPEHFVLLDALPLTSNGKIDRKALPGGAARDAAGMRGVVGVTGAAGVRGVVGVRDVVTLGTDQEQRVARIWAELLQVPAVELDDDFFELGGNSINALRIMNRLEKETGRRLPLASLFKNSTVEKLARLVDSDRATVSWDPLVAVKPEGHKPPLYIVHGSGMNVLTFNNMARHMDLEQPVYGFQEKGLNGVDQPFDKMEDIAADYVAGILKHDSSGAYSLAGYSFGGIVAFEMARQMKAMGMRVNMLAVIDTYADNSIHLDPAPARILKKIRRQGPKLLFVLRSLQKHPGATIRYQSDFLARRLHAVTSLFRKPVSDDQSTFEDRIAENYESAYRHYRLTPYDGVIDLFRVGMRLYYLDDPIYMGWKPYAGKGVRIHEVEGDHKDIFLPPYDKDFAASLQQVLNVCNRDFGAGE